MTKPIQKRAIATRSKLLDAAEEIVSTQGYGALRVEQVVRAAGVAKGTFFAHFKDKDAVMEILIGARIGDLLAQNEQQQPPDSTGTFLSRMTPLIRFMTSERYVFDLILRHSGAAAKEEIGPIAESFERQVRLYATWLSIRPFREDVPAVTLAEGIQALSIQCMALNFCAINSEVAMEDRLKTYLDAWLQLGPEHQKQ